MAFKIRTNILRYCLIVTLFSTVFFSCAQDDKSKKEIQNSGLSPLDSIVKVIRSLEKQIKLVSEKEIKSLDGDSLRIKLLKLKTKKISAIESFYGPNDITPIPDVNSLPNNIAAQTKLVCAIIPKHLMTKTNNGFTLLSPILKEKQFPDCPAGFCDDELYLNEINPSVCTGFSFKDDIIVTANHCIKTIDEAKNYYFVFNLIKSQVPLFIPDENVFSALQIISKKSEDDTLDFIMVKMDKKLSVSISAYLNKTSSLSFDEQLYMLGHPIGLPMKYTPNGKIFKITTSRVLSNIDAYGGNSGSPVFNSRTNRFEGILIKGLPDFLTTNKGCKKSCAYDYNKPKNGFSGESILRINKILLKYL